MSVTMFRVSSVIRAAPVAIVRNASVVLVTWVILVTVVGKTVVWEAVALVAVLWIVAARAALLRRGAVVRVEAGDFLAGTGRRTGLRHGWGSLLGVKPPAAPLLLCRGRIGTRVRGIGRLTVDVVFVKKIRIARMAI